MVRGPARDRAIPALASAGQMQQLGAERAVGLDHTVTAVQMSLARHMRKCVRRILPRTTRERTVLHLDPGGDMAPH